MSAFNYFTKIDLDLLHEAGLMRATARVQRQRPGVKARVATSDLCFYRPSTAGHSQAVQIRTVVEVEQVVHGMNSTRNPAHDFIVKLSPCTCSYIAALAGEMAGICGT